MNDLEITKVDINQLKYIRFENITDVYNFEVRHTPRRLFFTKTEFVVIDNNEIFIFSLNYKTIKKYKFIESIKITKHNVLVNLLSVDGEKTELNVSKFFNIIRHDDKIYYLKTSVI